MTENAGAGVEQATPNDVEQQKIRIEWKRLALERYRILTERKFFSRNFAAIATSIVSVAAVMVSALQLAIQAKEREQDAVLTSTIKLKELTAAEAQLQLQATEMLLKHKDELFSGPEEQRKLVRDVIVYGAPESQQQVLRQLLNSDVNVPVPTVTSLSANGTASASIHIPPSGKPRTLLLRATARAHSGVGGWMDLSVQFNGKSCAVVHTYRNPQGDPILAATTSCLQFLAPGEEESRAEATAPNQNADAIGVELTAQITESH